MFVAYAILAILLALMLVFSARSKLVKNEQVVEIIHSKVGVPMTMFPFLAACEIAGAIGLLIGLVYPPVGIAAAIGVALYFIGAVIAHLRVRDVKGLSAPLGPLVFSIIVTALATASA